MLSNSFFEILEYSVCFHVIANTELLLRKLINCTHDAFLLRFTILRAAVAQSV
jgi:hypothetical protein